MEKISIFLVLLLITVNGFAQEYSLSFDGVDDYVLLDDPETNSNPTFDDEFSVRTVELWYKAEDVTNTQVLYEEGAAVNGINIYIRDSWIWVGAWSEGYGFDGVWLSNPTTPYEWHHIALVYDNLDSNLFELIYDGNYINNSSISTNMHSHIGDDGLGCVLGSTKLDIGDYLEDGLYFYGLIDEARVWDTALTEEEIQANMLIQLSGNEAGLIAYWKMNEGTGDLIYDHTDNDNDGTIYGATWTEGFYVTEISIDVENIDVILQPGAFTDGSFNLSNIGEFILEYQIYTIDTTTGNRDLTGSYITCNADYYIPGATAVWTFTVFNNSGDDEWINEVIMDFPDGIYVNSATDFQGGSGGDLIYDGMTGDGVVTSWFGETGGGYGVLEDGEIATAQVNVTLDTYLVYNLMIDYQINGDEYGEEPHTVNGQVVINGLGEPVEWIALEPASGMISVGESEVIDYQIDAASLLEGLYTCDIIITGNIVEDIIIPVTLTVTGTSAGEVLPEVPLQLSNYPNPFNPSTTISFYLTVKDAMIANLEIYNIKGQKIKSFSFPNRSLGTSQCSVTWDGKDDKNQPLTSGIYLYKLQAGKQVLTKKMILLR